MNAHVLLNLLNKLRENNKMQSFAEHLIVFLQQLFFCGKFSKRNQRTNGPINTQTPNHKNEKKKHCRESFVKISAVAQQ